jgi:hypothetical protein
LPEVALKESRLVLHNEVFIIDFITLGSKCCYVLKDLGFCGLFLNDDVGICIIRRGELDVSLQKTAKRIITDVEVNFKIIRLVLLTHDGGIFLYIHHRLCTCMLILISLTVLSEFVE